MKGSETIEKLTPTSPGEGPPLPKAMGVRWPWKGKAGGVFEGKVLLEPKEIQTPFGRVEFGGVEIPPLKLPKLEGRHKKAFLHTLGIEGCRLLGLIPWVGGILADNVGAAHTREMKKLLTPEEFDKYIKYDRIYPDAIAFLRSRLPD